MKRKILSVLLVLVLVLSFSLVTVVPVAAQDSVTTTTLTMPDNVYLPAPFDVSSTTTNSGKVYDNVRFNIIVSGPEAFPDGTSRTDIFTITALDGNPETEGINNTFELVGGDFVGGWGPEVGFGLTDGYNETSVFTVQMNDEGTAPLGNYDVTVELVDLTLDGDGTLATVTGSFTLSADTLHVGSGQQFATIQAAIDDADLGDTIIVAAGTYDGFNADVEGITVKAALGETPVISGTGISWDGEVVGVVVTAGDVTIQGLKLTAQYYIGIWVEDAADAVQILDNTINNFNRVGILVRDVLSVGIEGNTISTTDYGDAPNGIQIANSIGITGTVKGNQVSDCHWGGYNPLTETYEEGWTGSGILVMDTESALEISGNEVQGCDVALDIEAGTPTLITNNDVHGNSYGFVLWNAAPAINFNNIYDNALGGVYLAADGVFVGVLDAEYNWWGDATGPKHATNPSATGDEVSDNVDYDPWLDAAGGSERTYNVENTDTLEKFNTIQDAIDAATDGDTITVAAGTYDELLTIDVEGLTLLGAQAGVDPRPTMSDGRSGAAESIIQNTYESGDPALNPILIVASNVTINGFTISPHYEVGVGDSTNGLNKDLIKQEPPDGAPNWEGTTIKYNILTATGYNIVDNCDELVQIKGVTGAVIEYNYGYHEIAEDSGGNAFSVADGSKDSVIRYNEIHKCSDYQYGVFGGAIYTYTSDNVSVIGNKVVGGGGITFGAGWTCSVVTFPPNTGGTVEDNIVEDADFGLQIWADDVTVSGNDVTGGGADACALNISGSNVMVQGNNLWNSGTGILVRDKQELSTTGVSINDNNIYGNTLGLENEAVAEVDATNNWWGQASGPAEATIVGNVDYEPWLLSKDGDPVATYTDYISLPDGWSLISPDRAWSDWEAMDADLIYVYDSGFSTLEQVSSLSPLTAIYVKTSGGGMMGVNYPAIDLGMYATNLEAGWNLIGIPETNANPEAILSSIRLGANNEIALATLASQGNYNPSGWTFYVSMLDVEGAIPAEVSLDPFDGYWACMNIAKEFGVVVVE